MTGFSTRREADRASGQAYASVLRDGAIAEVPVKLGLRSEVFSQVLSGLSEGDIVAGKTNRQPLNVTVGG